MQGLEFLSHSIDQKSASLKVLVESNFERFVRAKTTIDNVYAEMRNQGAEAPPEKTHSRVMSRSSTHFRTVSGQGPPTPNRGIHKPLPSDKKKNALLKESEYGVQGIKAPLIEVAVKAEEIWGPALGGREREDGLRTAMDSVEKHIGIFENAAAISECIKRKDYDTLVEQYSQARTYTDDAREIAKNTLNGKIPLTDSQAYLIVITGRMWSDVEDRVDNFKRDIWRKLTNPETNPLPSAGRNSNEEYMALINILLELGVEDNPIWVWLLSRYDCLKNKINATFERARVEIEVLRRRLANAEEPTIQVVAIHLKSPAQQARDGPVKSLDTTPVLELWDLIFQSLHSLLSVQGGLLGEVVDFWDKAQTFIEGKVQKTLPIGIDGCSRKHHRLSTDGVRDLQDGAVELIEMLRDNTLSFFTDPPIEDISMLYSPLPPLTPNTPGTPKSATMSTFAHQDSRFRFDENHPPPPSPRRGEAWEEFAFWPPYANSLSGVHYLEKLLVLLGVAAVEVAGMRPIAAGTTMADKMKLLVAGARERAARAVCAAWNRDADMYKVLEDWTRPSDRRDLTRMPANLAALETAVLSGMQKILYIPEATANSPGSVGTLPPPPDKLLQMVRNQFMTSLYKTLSGMVENTEKSMDGGASGTDLQLGSISTLSFKNTNGISIDVSNSVGNHIMRPLSIAVLTLQQNVRMLLTLNNLKALQGGVIPQLIGQFEINFSVKLTEESKTIQDVLGQIEARLFQSYTRPTVKQLTSIIYAGISSPTWIPDTNRPTEVRPYVYEALLLLVYLHTEVSTTAASLTSQIISHLLEQMSVAFLEAFNTRTRYSLAALMQATLDVEFVAQTMSQYTTEQASKIQSQIYLELDRGADPDASKMLQGELPEMRATLKKLREGTRSEFACFKKQRGQQKERSGGG